MKEEKCISCGDLYENGYSENNTDLCDLCIEKALAEIKGDPEINESDSYDLGTCHMV